MASETGRTQQEYSPLSKQQHFSRKISTAQEVALRQVFLPGLRFFACHYNDTSDTYSCFIHATPTLNVHQRP